MDIIIVEGKPIIKLIWGKPHNVITQTKQIVNIG